MSAAALRAAMPVALAVTATLAGQLAAQPRSAIPWLSESLRPEAVPPPPRPAGPPVPPAFGTETITVTPLSALNRDAVGLIAPEASGLPRDLWGPATSREVTEWIRNHPGEGVPAARALFRTILLAQADPPREPSQSATLLVARLDRLLEFGALADARAMIERAGPETPELFRRWFDIGILTNDANAPCAALRQNPSLSPTLPARVFCLARGGDWNAAEITLVLGEQIGSIETDDRQIIARFLDPEIFEDEPVPPPPDPLTPLDFLMREAVGLPRPPGPLPTAFLHHDLDRNAPMRGRAAAAERLVLSGGVAPDVLFEAYRAGAPAASGGVWDRAAAVQGLDAALQDGDAAAIAAALADADTRLAARGLRVALATEYAGALRDLDAAALPQAAAELAFELLLLAGDVEAARTVAAALPGPSTGTLLALAGAPGATPAPRDDLERAALDGLDGGFALDDRENRVLALTGEGRGGEVILEALDWLAPGTDVDPPAFRAALFALVASGQEPAARQIAIETLLLRPDGGGRP